MKTFNILLRNCMRIMWKFKWLILNLCLLLLIAITVLSSVFLSNVSLKESYNKLNSDGITPDFSIQKYAPDSQVKLDINTGNQRNKLIATNSKIPYRFYSPAKTSEFVDPTNPANNKSFYGFTTFYSDMNKDNPSAWPNLIYATDYEYCLPINTIKTPESYRNQLFNLFTFYNSGLYDSTLAPTVVSNDAKVNLKSLYNESLYSYNPWSLRIDPNTNNLMNSAFGLATIDGFVDKTNNFKVFLSTYDTSTQQIVGTLNTFSPSTVTQQQMQTVNAEVQAYESSPLNNNSSQFVFPTNPITDYNYYRKFLYLNGISQPVSFPEKLMNFSNQSLQTLKTNFFVTSNQEFVFDYKINPDTSSGIVKFLANHYYANKVSNESTKYFEGQIRIPVVPYFSIQPVPGYLPTANELLNPIDINNNKNWEIDELGIKALMSTTIDLLKTIISNQFNKYITQLSTSTVPEQQAIYKEYQEKFDVESYLKNNNFNYSVTSNFVYSTLGTNAIVANYESDPENNKIVLKSGLPVLKEQSPELNVNGKFKIEQVNPNTNQPFTDNISFLDLMELNFQVRDPSIVNAKFDISKENYLKFKLYQFFEIIYQAKMTLKPTDEDYIRRNCSFLADPLNTNDWELYWNKLQDFIKHYKFANLEQTGYGYKMSLRQYSNINGIYLEIPAEYNDPTSDTVVLSQNYAGFENNSNGVVDSNFLKAALQLPMRNYKITQDDINKNPYLYQKNYIYNPYTRKVEFYNDFKSWMNSLDRRYITRLNSEDYVIIGSGLSPEFMYPVSSAQQLMVNNNSPVVYTNNKGFAKIYEGLSVPIASNYWVSYNDSTLRGSTQIQNINNQFQEAYGRDIAYSVRDYSQPNQIIYTRMNFSRNILNVVVILTTVIGLIIALLAIFFLSILLRSVIKQNLNTFAIGLANGITKRKLALSFFPLALIPSFITALVGYGLSLICYPIINNAILSYWTLTISPVFFSFLVFGSIFLITSLLMFTSMICVIYWTLRKPTAVLLANGAEYKVNKLMQWTKPALTRMGALASFRGSFIFKNFSRFLVLVGLMTMFMTISSMFVSIDNSFSHAMQHTAANKKYNYSIDLFSPSESGGYYSLMAPDQMGTNAQGFTQEAGLPGAGVYNQKYIKALTYEYPGDPSKNIFYSNLALPSINYVTELQNNMNFFKNKFYVRMMLDINIQFLNIDINPWAWAKKAIPPSMLSVADDLYEQQMTDVFKYFLFEFENKEMLKSKNEFDDLAYTWYIDPQQAFDSNRSIKADLNNSNNPADWNQADWCYKVSLDQDTQQYNWKTRTEDINYGLPTYEYKPSYLKLVSTTLALSHNPYYLKYLSYTNQPLVDRNFMLSMNAVAFDKQRNQTYTYIDGYDEGLHTKFKVKGIDPKKNLVSENPESPRFLLLNEYENKNYVDDLYNWENNTIDNNGYQSSDGLYPLVINDVVSKKYGFNVNDILELTINNHFQRYKNQFYNLAKPTAKFKVIGITTSKSEEQMYTTQKVANHILGMTKPRYKPASEIIADGDYNAWSNQKAIDEYVPFNGIVTTSELPEFLTQGLSLYTPSGLNPLANQIPTNFFWSDSMKQIEINWKKINKIVGFELVDPKIIVPTNGQIIRNFSENYVKAFSSDGNDFTSYYLSALNSLDPTFASKILGGVMDKTSTDIMTIIISAFVPTLIIIILLLSVVIVQEARRLIALLKVQGFSDWTNAVSLSFIYYVVLVVSLLINIGLNYLLSWIMSTKVFSMFSIIINLVAPWWIYVTTASVLLVIFTVLTLTTFFKLKKNNLPEEINIR